MSDERPEKLQALREQSRRGLQFLISYLLTNAEQALLGMAGKSRSNVEQSQNYEAIRELRLKGVALERGFLQRALASFDTLGKPAAPAPAPSTPARSGPPSAEMRIDGLGVVKDALLEEQLAIENVASRARHQHRDALVRLARLVARDSGQRRVDLDTLPLGPQVLANAFMDACTELKIAPEARVVFYRLFTRFIIDELGPFYAQCLALFPEEEERQSGPAAVAAQPAAPAASDLPTGKIEDEEAQSAAVDRAETVWDSERTPLLAPPGKAMAMPRNLVDEVLFALQDRMLDTGKPLAALNPRAGIQPLDLIQLLNDTLAEMGYTRPMALPADVVEAVGLVRMLFEHALRDTGVPAPVRRVVRLLQIPLLRAALREPDVLTSTEHPARALFREIAVAGNGWTPPADGSEDDFLRLVKLLVVRVLNDYEKDTAVFRGCVDDLRRYLTAQQGAAGQEETRNLTAQVGKGEAQAARAAVAAVISDAASAAPLPGAVTEFLRGPWSDALFVIRLREGETSSEWGLALETTTRLVAATRTDGARSEFALAAQGLQRGLARLGLDENAAQQKTQALEAALSGAEASPAAMAAAPRAATRPPASTEFVQIVDRLAPDVWVEFREPGGVRRRLRLASRIPRTGQFVFVDTEGARALEVARNDLAAMIEQAEAKILHGVGPDGRDPVRPVRR